MRHGGDSGRSLGGLAGECARAADPEDRPGEAGGLGAMTFRAGKAYGAAHAPACAFSGRRGSESFAPDDRTIWRPRGRFADPLSSFGVAGEPVADASR